MQTSRRFACAAAVAALLVLAGAGPSWCASPAAAPDAAGLHAWTADAGAEAAWGAGPLDFWRAHGKEIAQVVSCAVQGASVVRLLALGSTLLGAAALAAGVLTCLA